MRFGMPNGRTSAGMPSSRGEFQIDPLPKYAVLCADRNAQTIIRRMRPLHQPKILVGTVLRFGKSEDITIEQALATKERYAHCPECNGLLRPHRRGRNGMGTHFEHLRENSSCSLSYTYRP